MRTVQQNKMVAIDNNAEHFTNKFGKECHVSSLQKGTTTVRGINMDQDVINETT